MTKKHFELIANAFSSCRPHNSLAMKKEFDQWRECVFAMCSVFYRVNNRFNRERFINACMK